MQLACAHISSMEGENYLKGMAGAANYAWVNRSSMTFLTRQVNTKITPGSIIWNQSFVFTCIWSSYNNALFVSHPCVINHTYFIIQYLIHDFEIIKRSIAK